MRWVGDMSGIVSNADEGVAVRLADGLMVVVQVSVDEV